MITIRMLAILVFGCLGLPAMAAKQALIIGNAAYSELPSLQNTHGDAGGYAAAFDELGFAVTYLKDLDESALEEAIVTFVDGIAPGDEVAFVFAGHGWSANGINYLIPVDAPKQATARLLARRSLALKNGVNGVLDEIAAQGALFSLAIIDACRDNPFEGKSTRSAGNTRGLARVEPVQGSFVIYSAGEGQTALDRLQSDGPDQPYSVFTRHFLPVLTSDMYLEDAVFAAQERTAEDARRENHLQIPAVYRQKLGKTCLRGTCGTTSAPPPPQVEEAVIDSGGWTVEQRVSGEMSLNLNGTPIVAPDGSSVMFLRSVAEYKQTEFQYLKVFLERYDGAGRRRVSEELHTLANALYEGPDGSAVLMDFRKFWLVDQQGNMSDPKGFIGGDVAYIHKTVPISDRLLRIYGKNSRAEDAPDVVFDIDLTTGVVHDPVFTKPADYRPMYFEPSGHFAIGYYVNKPEREIEVYAPDGQQLFAADVSVAGHEGLQWTTGPLGLYLLYRTKEQQVWRNEMTLMIKEWSGRETRREIRLQHDPLFPERVWPAVDENGMVLVYDGVGKTYVERFDISGQSHLWLAEIPGFSQGYQFPWTPRSLADGGVILDIGMKTPIRPEPGGQDGFQLIRIGRAGQVQAPRTAE